MKLSVVIPCHNAAPYLAQAIGSVIEQSYSADEIIVVDDASTDDSVAVARSFGNRIRLLTGHFSSAPAARTFGAAQATGDALMFLDADDVLGPTVLEALARALLSRPGAIAVCPWYRLDFRDGRWVRQPRSCEPRLPGDDALTAWLSGWYHPPCSVLWSRAAFERSGGWDETVKVNNDGDIMMRALVAGVPLVRTLDGESFYRRLPDPAASLSGKRTTRAGIVSRVRVLDKLVSALEAAGRLQRYRIPLALACDAAARDADAIDRRDLADRYRSTAHRLAGPRVWRDMLGARRVASRWLVRRWQSAVLRLAERAADPRRRPGIGRPVPYGLSGPADGQAGSTQQPLVSVIVPTFNRAALVARAIDSVLAQTYERFELLVVDDASTDDTADVIAACGDARVRHLRQDRNRGVAAARNRGFREARGELLALLDSDDEWRADKLARQVDRARRLPETVGLFYTGVATVGSDGSAWFDIPSHRGDIRRALLQRNVIHGCSSVMLRSAVVERVGGMDEALPAIEDYDHWLRVAEHYRADCIPEPLVRYHDPQDDTGAARRSQQLRANLAARAMVFDKHAEAMRRAGVAHLFLLDSARRHLRSPLRDTAAARRLVLEALRERPSCGAAYLLLSYCLAPPRTQALIRGLRNRGLATRRHAATRPHAVGPVRG